MAQKMKTGFTFYFTGTDICRLADAIKNKGKGHLLVNVGVDDTTGMLCVNAEAHHSNKEVDRSSDTILDTAVGCPVPPCVPTDGKKVIEHTCEEEINNRIKRAQE